MPDNDPGTGTGEEEVVATGDDETPSEGAEGAETSEADTGVEDDRPPINRIAEAQRKQRKAEQRADDVERQLDELRSQFREMQVAKGNDQPKSTEGGYTEEQLQAAYQMDPQKYGWQAVRELARMEAKKIMAEQGHMTTKESLASEADAEALRLYPDLKDRSSEFTQEVVQELASTRDRYKRAGLDPDAIPDLALNVANKVAARTGVSPAQKGDERDLDELSRTRQALRGEAPPVQPKPGVKKESEVEVPEEYIRMAKRQGRDVKKAIEFYKNDKRSQEAYRMLKEGY